jgi:hypothetical protein
MTQTSDERSNEQTEMIELAETEIDEVAGGRWYCVGEWCVRDITCNNCIWVY